MEKWDVDNHTSSRSLTHLAGNLNNKPAARNDHAAQPKTEPAPSRFALKPLALGLGHRLDLMLTTGDECPLPARELAFEFEAVEAGPHGRRILELLREQEMSAGEIAENYRAAGV